MIIKTTKLASALLYTVFLIGAGPWAQSENSDPIKFTVNVKGEYTDNRDSLKDGEDNFDVSLKPKIDVIVDWERGLLDCYFEPSYRYRGDPSDIQNDSEPHLDLGINLMHKLGSRVKLKLKERFNYTDDPLIQENGATLRRDCSYTMNRAEAGANFVFSRRSNVDLTGNHTIKQYDEEQVGRESDEERMVAALTFWHQVARTVAMQAKANFSSFGYDNTNIERGFDSTLGLVGMEKIFSPNFRGGVRLGWQIAEYDADELGSDNAPFVDVSFQLSTIPSTRIAAAVSYMLRNSDVYPFASQKQAQFHVKLEWDATAVITLGLAGTYRSGEYSDDSLETSVAQNMVNMNQETGGTDTTVIAKADIAYKLNLNTSIKLTQQYEGVDSDIDVSFTRNATSLFFSRQF